MTPPAAEVFDARRLQAELDAAQRALAVAPTPFLQALCLLKLAVSRQRLACLVTPPDAQAIAQAMADADQCIALVPLGNPQALTLILAVAELHMDATALLQRQREGEAERAVHRVRELVALARRIVQPQDTARIDFVDAQANCLAYVASGDRAALQRCLRLLDRTAANPRAALVSIDLHATQFENTGERELLERGIALGERVLASAGPDIRGPAAGALSRLFAQRAVAAATNAASPAAMDGARRDADRAVALAHAFAPDPMPPAARESVIASAQGIALRARAVVSGDPADLRAAALLLLRASALVGPATLPGLAHLNDAAILVGQLAAGALEAPRQSELLDHAISLILRALGDAGADRQEHAMRPLRASLAELLVRRRTIRGGAADTARALEELRLVLPQCLPGDPRRASTLDLFVEACVQEIVLDGQPGNATAAVAAALEAEAIAQSGAPVGTRTPRPVDALLTACRSRGLDPGDLHDGRVEATRALLVAWPEAACRLATARAEQAMDTAAIADAADYAAIALEGQERAMLIGDSPDWAHAHAAALAEPACRIARRVGARLAAIDASRAIVLLERAQASALVRLRQSTVGSGVLASGSPEPAAVRRHAAARRAMHEVIRARRAGRLSATVDALHDAEQALASSTGALLAGAQGSSAASPLVGLEAVARAGAPCVYVVAGDAEGIALAVSDDGGVDAIALPAFGSDALQAQLMGWRDALDRFEQVGAGGVAAFERGLEEVAAWLRASVVDPLQSGFANRAWTMIPCGPACDLPWSAATHELAFTFTPGVQLFGAAAPASTAAGCLLVAEPGHEGQQPLPDVDRFAEWLGVSTGAPVTLLTGAEATPEAVVAAARSHGTVVFYAHGVIDRDAPLESGVLLHGRSRLDIRAILRSDGAFERKVVVIASCSQGRVDRDLPAEMFGPSTAFLAAGARLVVSPSWPVEVGSAQTVAAGFLQALRLLGHPGEALATAQARARRWGARDPGAGLHIAGLRRARVEPAPGAEAPHDDWLFHRAAFAVYGRAR